MVVSTAPEGSVTAGITRGAFPYIGRFIARNVVAILVGTFRPAWISASAAICLGKFLRIQTVYQLNVALTESMAGL